MPGAVLTPKKTPEGYTGQAWWIDWAEKPIFSPQNPAPAASEGRCDCEDDLQKIWVRVVLLGDILENLPRIVVGCKSKGFGVKMVNEFTYLKTTVV